MRVLATVEPDDLPIDPAVFEDLEEAAAIGVVPGIDMEQPYDAAWDPQPNSEQSDYGFIGEDAKGIWLRRHPSAILVDHPKLWAVVDEFRYGNQEIQPGEYSTRSAYEMEARLTMAAAYSRRISPKRDTEE